jgi:O-succinylbenzoate synthase
VILEHHVAVPLRAPFGGHTVRHCTLLEGPAGWGEISPLPGYPCDPAKARQAAEEAALYGWPPPVRQMVPVNALVPAVAPAEASALAVEAVATGARCVKVKVGTGDDVGRVSAVRDAVGRDVRLRLDANGAWDVDQAVDVLGRLIRFDLELVEQPVASLEDLALVRRRVNVAVAADECVRGVEDARQLARLAAADAVVLKVQPLGGVVAAMEVAEAAAAPAVVSSLIETSVGLAAGLALAAALPELWYACGLGTGSMLAADVVTDPLLPWGGLLTVRRPVPDPALLAQLEATAGGQR